MKEVRKGWVCQKHLKLIIYCLFIFIFFSLSAFSHHDDKLIIGGDFNYPPYEFLDKNGKPKGYNVELSKALAKVMGLKIEIRLQQWGKTRQDLEEGRIDAIHGMYYSQERTKHMDFSTPHTLVHHRIFCRKDNPSLSRLEELSKPLQKIFLRQKKIIVMQGDIMHDWLVENNVTSSPLLLRDQAEALQLLASGIYDYALVAELPGLYWIKKFNLSNLTVVGAPILSPRYCYAVKNGNEKLLNKINHGLNILRNTGEYQRITSKWLENNIPTSTFPYYFLQAIGLILGALLLLLAGVFFWSRSLKKQVFQRTQELEQEIREKERIEEALADSEKNYRMLVETMSDGLAVQDKYGRVIFANQRMCQLFGYSDREILELKVIDFLDQDVKANFIKKMQQRRKGDQTPYEIEMLKKDGTKILAMISPKPLFDANKKFMGSMAIITDVTALKKSEMEREQILLHLQERIKELSCLYGVAHSIRTRNTMEEIFQDLITIIPGGWQYPEITQGKITFDGKVYKSIPFKETQWKLSAEIIVNKEKRGSLEVFYLEERPKLEVGPFMEDEKILLEAIAQSLSEAIQLKLAQEGLVASLKEKEILLQEIHHRVKNNMTVISSLLNIQASIQEDPKLIDILKEASNRIRIMAMVHEQIYQSKDLASVDFYHYVNTIANNIMGVSNLPNRNMQLVVEINEIYIEIKRAIPCGLIINELLTNAIKYAFPSGKNSAKIFVLMQFNQSKKIELIIKDNGCGLPKEIDIATTNSMGLRLVHLMVKQLKGTIEINRREGTEFKITFNS